MLKANEKAHQKEVREVHVSSEQRLEYELDWQYSALLVVD